MIPHSRPTLGTVRKNYKTFTVTRHLKNSNSTANSSPFLVKLIAKLERTQSNEYPTKDNTEPTQTMGGT